MAKKQSLMRKKSAGPSRLEQKWSAESELRKATRAARKSERLAGVDIQTKKRAGMSTEEMQAEAQRIMQERHRKVSAEMQKIKATKGQEAHKKASMLFDLAGNKDERRKLRKALEGKESGTNLQSASDALSVSREKLLEWESEGNSVSLVNDGIIIF